MLTFYGAKPPGYVQFLTLGGICPHCKSGSRFTLTTLPDNRQLFKDHISRVVLNYSCDICLGPIPIEWHVIEWSKDQLKVESPKLVLRSREPFDFEHVPEDVKKEIEEALGCLSVNAYNGFAAVCRRAIQAISTNLGSGASTKVKKQIEEMIEITGLDDEWKELATQIMLSGHDGSHPHLPDVNVERATVLLSLLKDLTYQLYTRPGKIKESAELRKKAISQPDGVQE